MSRACSSTLLDEGGLVNDSSELGTLKPSIASNNVASRNYRLDGKKGKNQVFSAVQARSRSGRQGGCCHGVHGVLCDWNVSAQIVFRGEGLARLSHPDGFEVGNFRVIVSTANVLAATIEPDGPSNAQIYTQARINMQLYACIRAYRRTYIHRCTNTSVHTFTNTCNQHMHAIILFPDTVCLCESTFRIE